MSSNWCRIFIPTARIDLAKIMKLMLRVSSESKYSFFKRMVIQHIVENGCSRDQRKLNFFCPEVVKSEFDLQNLGCESCLRCESSSKAGLKVFVKNRVFFVADSTSGVIVRRSLLKVDERESGELFGELFWNDVAYFFPMINFCNLSIERRRNGNDIFCLRNCWRSRVYPLASTLTYPGRR